jgi:uncharacterized membrane protein YbhN (UPF0104 family)
MADARPAASPIWRAQRKRLLAWGLACVALVFVVNAVPVRDRCDDPAPQAVSGPSPSQSAKPARVAVSREGRACVVHRPDANGGDVRLSPAECAQLRCEPGLASTFQGTRVGPLAALLVLYFAGTLAWAARFRALIVLAGVPVTVRETWRITLESQAGGILLPGGIGGDALRVGFVVGRGGDLTTVIAAVLLDRVIGLVTVAGLAAALAAAYGGGDLGPLCLVLGAIPIAFAVGLCLARWQPFARASIFTRGPLARVARPVLAYLGDPRAPRAIALALGISVLVSATQLAVIRGIIAALGATPLVERWVYMGTTMTFIVGSIPALPGGWGTSDAAFVFFLGKAGLAASTALAVGLLYRLFWYSSGAVGVLLYLLRQHASPSPRAPEVPQSPQ